MAFNAQDLAAKAGMGNKLSAMPQAPAPGVMTQPQPAAPSAAMVPQAPRPAASTALDNRATAQQIQSKLGALQAAGAVPERQTSLAQAQRKMMRPSRPMQSRMRRR